MATRDNDNDDDNHEDDDDDDDSPRNRVLRGSWPSQIAA